MTPNKAEWYYEKSPELQKQECSARGFEVAGIENGSWLRFANVDFGNGVKKFEAKVSAAAGGHIEIRLDDLNGPLLGTAVFSAGAGTISYSLKEAWMPFFD